MDLDDTRRLLVVRRDLTGEQFNDGTIHAWQQVFCERTLLEVSAALVDAAKRHPRIGVAVVVAELPERAKPDEVPVDCGLCAGSGMVTVWETHGGSSYSAVVACDCFAGEAMRPVLGRIIVDNNRELDRLAPQRDRAYTRLARPPTPGQP